MPAIPPNHPYNPSSLHSLSTIITGGASGLGAAISLHFATHGAYVTIADRDPILGQALASKLRHQGYHASFIHCDTTSWSSSVNAFRHAVNFSPRKTLDVAALFAGTDGEARGLVDIIDDLGPPVLSDSEEDGNVGLGKPPLKAVDVNLYGVYYSAYLSLYYMRLPPATTSSQHPPDKAPSTKSLIFVS